MEPDPFWQSLPDGTVLPPAVGTLHGVPGHYSGRCSVQRGGGRLVDLMLRLGGFPGNADDTAVTVKINRTTQEWTWERDFDGHTTCSRLTFDPKSGYVREKLRWVTLWLQAEISDGKVLIHIQRLSVFGIPCSGFLLPQSSTAEWEGKDGLFRFDVSAKIPMLGQLIRYRGWLAPVHAQT